MAIRCRLLCLLYAAALARASASPPLQWINLSNLLSGPSPPPLKDASIGYDDTTRSIIIFGGESAGEFVQDSTYLLNLNTLTWSTPSPPNGLSQSPPARSQAVSGDDFAASYRNAHVVIGGRGADGNALSDAWVFDYNNQFWSSVTLSGSGPSVFDAVGGNDVRTPFDPVSTSNTFFVAGGKSSVHASPGSLSQTYSLEISGTLSSNLPNSCTGKWTKQTIGSLPSLSGLGGTVIGQKVISVGGCTAAASPNASCATQNSYVLDTTNQNAITPTNCGAPRLNPAIVANQNGNSPSFNNQVFAMLGVFNTSLWNDGNGLEKNGEVDILDISAGTWTRVLPSGDPSSSTQYPTPRQGAAALSFQNGLVGSSRSAYSDAIVFGGQDASGNYLDDVWILRAYDGSLSSSGAHWSGYGSGNLQSGASANGQGVTVQFNSACATQIATPSSSSSSTTSPSSTASSATKQPTPSTSPPPVSAPSSPASNIGTYYPYNAAVSHKIIAPVSVVLFLPAVILYRLSVVPESPIGMPNRSATVLRVASFAVGAVAYALGVAGLVLSFTSISENPRPAAGLNKRASHAGAALKTAHGLAGLVLFLLLYGLVPCLFLVSALRARFSTQRLIQPVIRKPAEITSVGTMEKLTGAQSPSIITGGERSAATTPGLEFPPAPARRPTHQWRSAFGRRQSHDSAASVPEAEPASTFEVVNRGPRKRQHSNTNTLAISDGSHRPARGPSHRSLSDMSWMERRRSVNAVNDLDYALTQLHRSQREPEMPRTAEGSTRGLTAEHHPSTPPYAPLPPAPHVLLHSLAHALLLALSTFSLVALWQRGPLGAFAVILALTALFYAAFVVLAWHGRPADSALAVLFARIRGDGAAGRPMAVAGDSRPLSPVVPGASAGPYLHSPPFRQAAMVEEDEEDDGRSGFLGSPRVGRLRASEEEDGEVSDDDEDTRQRRIEDEMARRDVSIVTVPRRKLWITNPS